ncbi:MAG: peptide chain release factor 2 [Planctomycetota bacterium]|nr:MAG: peptide chain release factor 2 [Planctomycetota bacterium]
MNEILEQIQQYGEILDSFYHALDLENKEKELHRLEKKMSEPGFWDNSEEAQEMVQKIQALKGITSQYKKLAQKLEDFEVMAELLQEEENPEEAENLEKELEVFSKDLAALELQTYLSHPHDNRNAYFSIHPGSGGTESCDWAEILYRMYRRWMEKKGFTVEVLDYQPGEEAGIKKVTLLVKGPYAFGYLKSEVGVHRLVRISPFDANKRRHTSFAAVDAYPELEDIEIEIKDEDLRIDTYRSSGAGGQHVNVTDSAVRITHIPSGIVVQCQNERSQHKNKAMAMKMLKARLYQKEEEKRNQERQDLYGKKGEISWGKQIRSYVLHPYTLVKDHRTGYEKGNALGVLEGDLDGFIDAYLKWTAGKEDSKVEAK